MRAIIFVNGQFHNPEIARQYIQPDDYIIAVNGGTRHALLLDVLPDVIIGDQDSLPTDAASRLKDTNVRFLTYPAQKDETDLELALLHAVEQHCTRILLLAAFGGRIDQGFANMFLLTLPELQGIDVRILDSNQTAFLIRDEAAISGNIGDTVSVLPFAGDAIGVTNSGFKWPLHNATLSLGTTRGISNVLLEKYATIRIKEGMLLCVVTQQR
ncbi:thiamine diphosphokinase [candidate division KSB3 bacterium]|uniref:Thiamine diphosphokinase n=1 Tax=candidate division KSB3 bacterium TaxID=2044937 RepID=A0A2G6KH43_9BACT|nr:MAG: thiamine diphosphokinase [candidate division KSB3 bacterium]